ncbi:GGDEF domain-containing protein [Bacillus salinus]|uniref:GGDEF domain-containing protein n=1 Tax=Bacillus sp. HMF5848 TaxID=2495421 RepID=UPI00163A147B|nr:GGDEF domain-containing protein [Bacillus sp. HMF5848]
MYRDLIINLAIFISFLTVSGQFFKSRPMYANFSMKVVGGLIGGVLGSLLMSFSIQVTDTTIVDLRNFAIIVVTLFGGVTSGIITGIVIAINRFAFFGINISSTTALITLLLLPVICGIIAQTKLSNAYKFFFMTVSQMIVFYIAVAFLISDFNKLITLYIYYGAISLIGGFIIFQICNFIVHSNENFRMLKESAEKDYLTGLNNVRQFDTIWNTLVNTAIEKQERLSLLLIDIDHFKKINDTYGHQTGDMVLKQLGTILKNTSRSFDIVSRNGGEEFSVILPDCPNHQAIELAEKIRKAVENYDFNISDTDKINITVSIGISTFPDTTDDWHTIIKRADDSLYTAKRLGRNRVSSYVS